MISVFWDCYDILLWGKVHELMEFFQFSSWSDDKFWFWIAENLQPPAKRFSQVSKTSKRLINVQKDCGNDS